MNIRAAPDTIHASAVAVGERGILIRGSSGSGKSALALALIDDPRLDARLIGDDRLILSDGENGVVARPPEAIAGLIEVRGVGIVTLPYVAEASIALVVDLLPAAECPRHPDEAERTTLLLGRPVPRLALPIGANDGPLRVRMALQAWIR